MNKFLFIILLVFIHSSCLDKKDEQLTDNQNHSKSTYSLDSQHIQDKESNNKKEESAKIVSEQTQPKNYEIALLDFYKGKLQRVFVTIDSTKIKNTELIKSIICEIKNLPQVESGTSVSFFTEKKYANYKDILFINEGHPQPIAEYENWKNYYYLAEYDFLSKAFRTYPGCEIFVKRKQNVSIDCE